MKQQVQTFTLPNGIRVAHMYSVSKVAYCGLSINTGTRDELPGEHGMAHFLEHTLFKGTHKRRAYHINNRLESVGGELNAFTGKEETVIHATVLKTDIGKAIDLIADISFNSSFPEKEIEKEKTVIYDEIDSFSDSPSDLIFDDFEDLLFAGSSLGHSTLGTKQAISRFTRNDIRNFIGRTYNTTDMVFSVVGQVSFNKIQQQCEKYFADKAANKRDFNRQAPSAYTPFTKKVHKNTYQAHCIIGNRAYDSNHNGRITLSLLANLLGGPMSNSVLNTVLREKYGLVYNIETNYTAYSDTGVVTIYFGTSKENLDKSIDLINAELQKMRNTPLSSLQLHKAKKQLIGQLSISCESNEQQMISMAKSLLLFNRYETMPEIIKRIEAVTAADMLDVANEVFNPKQLSSLLFT